MNPRHKAFADEYLKNGMNATKAYLFISPKVTINTAEVEGHKYLKKPKIKEYIESKQKKASQNSQIDFEWVLKTLYEIAVANRGEDDRTAITALQEINRMIGNHAPTKTENTNRNIDVNDVLNELNKK